MPRETTKHAARADEELAAEWAGGAEPGGPTRLDEPLDDPALPGEHAPPAMGIRPAPIDDVTEGGSERAVRQELVARLHGAPFPPDRNALLRHIGPDRRGAVAAHLRALPAECAFEDAEAVAMALGGMHSDK